MKELLNELSLIFPKAVAIVSLQGGIENKTFFVRYSVEDIFVVRIYLSKSQEEANQEITLLLSVSSSVKCAKPILKVGNGYIFFVGGYPSCAFEYIDGTHPNRDDLQLVLFNDLGKTLGSLHNSTRSWTYRKLWNETDTLRRAKELANILTDGVFNRLNSFIREEIKLYESHFLLDTQFSAVLHADVDASNIIFNENSLSFFLIDFDDSTQGAVELDLAITVRNLVLKCKNVRDCVQKAEQLLKGYREATNYAIKNLGRWVRFACFRHLLLMLSKSFQSLSYPSANDINYLIWEKALKYEILLNEL